MTSFIKVFTQSAIRIEDNEKGKVIYFDPLEIGEKLNDADVIFITHDHYDHFSPDDIEKVMKQGTILAVPEGMKAKAEKEAPKGLSIVTVRPGEKKEIGGFSVEAVPAYNNMKPFHQKHSGWVGYVVEACGKRIYVAGDTDMTRDNEKVRCDIALIPIGGKFTMDAHEAAKLINTIKPEIAIPTHYGTIVGKKADADVFAAEVDKEIKVEIKL